MFGHLLDARTPHLGPHDLELESQPCCAMRHFRCGHANSVFCDLIYKISLLWSSVVGDRSFSAAGLRLWNDLPPGLGGRDLPSTPPDNLWKLNYLATEALSDFFEFIGAIG